MIALGLALIRGILKVLNLAHGEFIMLGMYATYFLYTLGIDPFFSLPFSIIFLFIIGALVYKSLITPSKTPENQILVTFGLMFILQNLVLMVCSPDYRSITLTYGTWSITLFNIINASFLRLVILFSSLASTVFFHLFFKYTKIGKGLHALSQNPEAASLVGINVTRYQWIAFAIGSAVAGLAGTFLSTVYYIYPTVGQPFTVTALMIVILGGMGNFLGTFLGGILIGIAESLGSLFIATECKEIIAFIIFIVILIFRPQGIFGRSVEKY